MLIPRESSTEHVFHVPPTGSQDSLDLPCEEEPSLSFVSVLVVPEADLKIRT